MAVKTISSAEVSGAPCWVSLLTHDMAAAQRFYGGVLGWQFRSTRLGDEFSIAFRGGMPVAGLGVSEGLSVPVAWTPYFAVESADEAAARIRERSATVAVGPVSFVTGRAALAADRDGAVFGIWEGRVLPHWGVFQEAAPVWIELRTRDAFDAAIFYGEVLGWAVERQGGCEVSYEGDQVVLRHAGHGVARLRGGAVEADPDPQVRPRWHVHFRVPRIEDAVKAAVDLGGRAVTSVEVDGPGEERSVTLRDPHGGLFTATESPPEALPDTF
ncbi:VOC family protein [Streptomyces sp. NPDC012888]|uniref:VOC family protein n=1 Tax=Streptomyces sp. NPDC012888 TaxID=3364855 RepID=UPI00368CA94C